MAENIFRALRSGRSQEKLAQAIGVTRACVMHWEKGRSVPEPRQCLKLAIYAAETCHDPIPFIEMAGLTVRDLRNLACFLEGYEIGMKLVGERKAEEAKEVAGAAERYVELAAS
jgi:DNA-binding XRE family transcriptional regulator